MNRGKEEQDSNTCVLQREIREVEDRAAGSHQACEEALGDYRHREATREVLVLVVRLEEEKKKKEWKEVKAKRMSCEAVKEEDRRKEAELIQVLRNRAGEL